MFGGLLAGAIANMDGIRGMSSWRWLFVLEGLATIVVGFASYPLIPDFPEDTRWLSQEEKDFITSRAGICREKFQPISIHHVVRFLADIKNIAGGLMYFGGMSNAISSKRPKANVFVQLSLFLPTVSSRQEDPFLRYQPTTLPRSRWIFLPYHCQDARLLEDRNAITHRPSFCRSFRTLHHHSLFLGPSTGSIPIYCSLYLSYDHRFWYPYDRTP